MEEKTIFKYSVPFTMVANELIMCEFMSSTLKTIYSIACCYACIEDHSCFPSYTTIARKAGVSRRTAIRMIQELVLAGLLEKETRKNKLNEYTSNIYTIHQWSEAAALYFKRKNVKAATPSPAVCEEAATIEDESVPDKAPGTSQGGSDTGTPPLHKEPPGGGDMRTPPSDMRTPPPGDTGTPPSDMRTPPSLYEQYSNINNHFINNNQSINPGEAEDQDLNAVLERAELEQFSPEIQATFQNTIERLYYTKSLKIGNAVLPADKVRSYLHLIDGGILEAVLTKMKNNREKIKNPIAWMMSTLINEICTAESELILGLPPQYQNDGNFYASG